MKTIDHMQTILQHNSLGNLQLVRFCVFRICVYLRITLLMLSANTQKMKHMIGRD